jgi:hypothetical protein
MTGKHDRLILTMVALDTSVRLGAIDEACRLAKAIAEMRGSKAMVELVKSVERVVAHGQHP